MYGRFPPVNQRLETYEPRDRVAGGAFWIASTQSVFECTSLARASKHITVLNAQAFNGYTDCSVIFSTLLSNFT